MDGCVSAIPAGAAHPAAKMVSRSDLLISFYVEKALVDFLLAIAFNVSIDNSPFNLFRCLRVMGCFHKFVIVVNCKCFHEAIIHLILLIKFSQ